MTYETPRALRMALEQRLQARSTATGVALDRLRRRVIFERIVTRLQVAEPELWVLNGGMALEVRLRDAARLTKDIDLGLRDEVSNAADLRERVTDALSVDQAGDGFVLRPGLPSRLTEDEGQSTWRLGVAAWLAGKPFGGVKLDISPRAHDLTETDRVELPNSLDFAGVTTPIIEIVALRRHAAEKFHAMLKEFGDRENTRVRDLVDLVILTEHELLQPPAVAQAVVQVWSERDGVGPPTELPRLPVGWPDRYETLAAEHGLGAASFPAAFALVAALWAEMFPTKET